MWGKIHLLLVRTFLRPFYLINNTFFFVVGDILRKIFVFIFKCDLSPVADIPLSTRFPHYIGIVIGACEMGENCIIRNNVTIGKSGLDKKYLVSYDKKNAIKEHKAKFPVIGSKVVIGSNACIIGSVKVGSNSVIGAGSVVVHDVDPNSIYAGVPAKKIRDLSVS